MNTMTTVSRNGILTWTMALLAGAAYGQVPSTNDTSDNSDNTGMGTDALHSLTTGNDNTASGRSALYSNTTGSSNTASGAGALNFNTTGSYNTASGYQRAQFQHDRLLQHRLRGRRASQ